jgi:hypothetical protein
MKKAGKVYGPTETGRRRGSDCCEKGWDAWPAVPWESREHFKEREKEIRTTAVSTRLYRKKCPSLFTHTGMISSLLSVQRSKFSIVTYWGRAEPDGKFTATINLPYLLYSIVLTNLRLQRKVILKTTYCPTFYCTESAYNWASGLSGWRHITQTKIETPCLKACWLEHFHFQKFCQPKNFYFVLVSKITFQICSFAKILITMQSDSKRLTQFCTSIFPELYKAYQWTT